MAPATAPARSAPIADVPRPERETSRAAPARPHRDGTTYVVRPGDNLWVIAQRTLEEHDRPAAELVAYWHTVIEANAEALRSGDPNLIYPGEILTLPAVGDNQ
jgi:nucleoid-associated protein YgaU